MNSFDSFAQWRRSFTVDRQAFSPSFHLNCNNNYTDDSMRLTTSMDTLLSLNEDIVDENHEQKSGRYVHSLPCLRRIRLVDIPSLIADVFVVSSSRFSSDLKRNAHDKNRENIDLLHSHMKRFLLTFDTNICYDRMQRTKSKRAHMDRLSRK